MGATALLTYAALNAGVGLGSPDMHCGFPSTDASQPAFVMEVQPDNLHFGIASTLPVQMALRTERSDMRMAAVAQPLGPYEAPFVVIAGSPMTNVSFQLGLKDDGSASLTIRDARKGDRFAAEVTRVGKCTDHEEFFLLFTAY